MALDLPLLITDEQLAQQLDHPQLLVVQVTSAEAFARAHIPGAIHMLPSDLMSGCAPAKGSVPDTPQLEHLFQRIGLEADTHLVAYDDEGGGWAGRLIWTLDYIKHAHYSYLDGGLHAWYGAGRPLAAGSSAPKHHSEYTISELNPQVRATRDYILEHLPAPETAIWDARSPAEYTGEQVLTQRAGHIPGAINYEWTQLMDTANDLRLLPLETIQTRLNELGLGQDKAIITHCQSHHRSGLTYLAAKILGYQNVRGYDGSWSEWGNDSQVPIEN